MRCENPTISVILPTHDRATVLARSMRSVLAQSFGDLELIVVDDASTDNTTEVVARFDDPRVVYHRLDANAGAAAARNAGALIARGQYLAFQDSDDEWLLDKLDRQLDALRRYKADLLCCAFASVRDGGNVVARRPDSRMQSGNWGADNIYDFFFITPTWLIDREKFQELGGFDERLHNLEDWELSFRLFKAGQKIIAIDEVLMLKYASSQDSLNRRLEPRIHSLDLIINRHQDIWSQHHPSGARLYAELGRLQSRAGKMRDGRANLLRSIRLDARPLKRWLHLFANLAGFRAYSRLTRSSAGMFITTADGGK